MDAKHVRERALMLKRTKSLSRNSLNKADSNGFDNRLLNHGKARGFSTGDRMKESEGKLSEHMTYNKESNKSYISLDILSQ